MVEKCRGFGKGLKQIRRILIVTNEDMMTIATQESAPTVSAGDLLCTGDQVASGVVISESGEVLSTTANSVTLRVARPYLVSPGAILQIDDDDLVQRGDNLALLVFERTKTGDIIQGLPRIEELLEARKPKEMCILCQRPGAAQMQLEGDDTTEIKVVEKRWNRHRLSNWSWPESHRS